MKRARVGFLLPMLVLLSAFTAAQDNNDDFDDDEPDAGSAALYLNFDRLGGARFNFGMGEKPQNWNDVRLSLAAALHCPEQRFTPFVLTNQMQRTIASWPDDRRARYLQSFAEYQQRNLVGRCDSVLAWNGVGRSGSLDFSPVLYQLKRANVQKLWVNVAYPQTDLVEYSRQNLSYSLQDRFISYSFETNSASASAPVRLSFGMGRSKFYRSLAIAFAFLLLPLAVTLYMRRAALVSGKLDPTAAWFSYFRTVHWCINGAMLLWITSGLGARQALQNCITFAVAPGWTATLLDIAVVIGPAFIIYFACVAGSYPLHVNLRGSAWTRREFLIEQLVNVGAQALPLMFLLAAASNLAMDGALSTIFFLCTIVSWIVFRSLKMRVSNSYPFALTRGELRDRVFALAAKAGVTIKQIFVLPAGKGQIANAYATGGQVVMFTDYLLQHLTKREVEGVAAHEIAHIQLGHVKKRALTFYAVLMVPAFLGGFAEIFMRSWSVANNSRASHAYHALAWFWQWSQRDFILLLLGLLLFYFVSRRYEHQADERGALLTGDPEAQISGLLKLSRLNLMPVQWGRGTGSWLTHPSLLRRAESIAASSGMSADQLSAVLERHRMQSRSGAQADPADDHYAVPEATNPETLASTAKKQSSHQFRLWTALLVHVAPPGVFAWIVQSRHLHSALSVYLFGAVLTPLLSITYSLWLGVFGRKSLRTRLWRRFEREGSRISSDSMAVGFSPGAVVRFYGLNYYNWDIGLLDLSSGELSFHGEQVRFSIPANQINGMCIGQGGPNWWKFPRVYVRWKGADGKLAVFSIASLEPCTFWSVPRQARGLLTRLQEWRWRFENASAESSLAEAPPAVGEITSRTPSELGGLKVNLTLAFYLVPLAMAVNAVLRTDALWYMLSVVALTRFVESIPFCRFHDRLLNFSPAAAEIAIGAKASQK